MAKWKDNPNEFAIEVIEGMWQEGEFHIDEYGGDYDEWRAECDELIAEVNATEVKPVTHAHWILSDKNHDIWDCDNCKVHVFINTLYCKANFCPQCGAKMDLLD